MNWHIKEKELKRHNHWCSDPIGVVIRDPGFKIGQEIKEVRKSGGRIFLRVRERKDRNEPQA